MGRGSVTDAYGADRERVVEVLNQALATELVCVLRYKRHYFTAQGVNAQAAAAEFLQHATEEQGHADMIAARITQLRGEPDFDPDTLTRRSHAEYDASDDLGGDAARGPGRRACGHRLLQRDHRLARCPATRRPGACWRRSWPSRRSTPRTSSPCWTVWGGGRRWVACRWLRGPRGRPRPDAGTPRVRGPVRPRVTVQSTGVVRAAKAGRRTARSARAVTEPTTGLAGGGREHGDAGGWAPPLRPSVLVRQRARSSGDARTPEIGEHLVLLGGGVPPHGSPELQKLPRTSRP